MYRYPTNSLERALMSLELIARRPGGLTHTEISQMLAIPKSSCSYILGQLERHHYLIRDKDTGRYEVGLKLVGLAHGVREDSKVSKTLAPLLRKFVEETGLTVAVGVLRQGNVVLIENVDSARFTRVKLSVGMELSYYSMAVGKLLVAVLPKRAIDEIIDRYGLSTGIETTSNSKTNLLRELETIRKQQYATNTRVRGVYSVAVPIFDAAGAVRAGLVATGSKIEKAWNHPKYVMEQLRMTAQEIELAIPAWPSLGTSDYSVIGK